MCSTLLADPALIRIRDAWIGRLDAMQGGGPPVRLVGVCGHAEADPYREQM